MWLWDCPVVLRYRIPCRREVPKAVVLGVIRGIAQGFGLGAASRTREGVDRVEKRVGHPDLLRAGCETFKHEGGRPESVARSPGAAIGAWVSAAANGVRSSHSSSAKCRTFQTPSARTLSSPHSFPTYSARLEGGGSKAASAMRRIRWNRSLSSAGEFITGGTAAIPDLRRKPSLGDEPTALDGGRTGSGQPGDLLDGSAAKESQFDN